MGAMGSKDRMDYTVLGDHVNLAARLCSAASPGQTLMAATSYQAIADHPEFKALPLTPISVKGKNEPIRVYDIQPNLAHAAPEVRSA